MILETGKLVNNDHVKIKWHSAAFNEPLHILTVDDVEVCLLPECRKPLFTAAQHQTVIQPLKVIPLGDLGGPTILTYTNRGDDQYLAYLKLVKHEVVQRRQGDAGLAESAFQQDCRLWVCFDEVHSELLIVMGFVFHQ